jgi:asparagine synthase (glutamine-hydrolysing)
MKHRGPDGSGCYQNEQLLLFHTRLAIQDLSERAAQPMTSADGRYTLCYNGEIYNHAALRRELHHKAFKTTSDTETLLYLLAEQGMDAIENLNGIFAFAFYDNEAKTILIARDHFGVKPLYYALDKEVLCFASELKTLLLLGGERQYQLNTGALLQCLQLQYNLPDESGFKQIKRLGAGMALLFDLKNGLTVSSRKKSTVYNDGHYLDLSLSDWTRRLEEALFASVERQLLSDKEVAYFLSGGIDSGLLVSLATKIRGKGLNTYCIQTGTEFINEGFSDDASYAKILAREQAHHLTLIPAESNILDSLDAIMASLEELQADPAALFVGQISAHARSQGHQVMLSGTGADDIFSGYRRHQAIEYARIAAKTPAILLKAFNASKHLLPQSVQRRAAKLLALSATNERQRIRNAFYWCDTNTALTFFQPDLQSQLRTAAIEKYFDERLAEIPETLDSLDKMLHLEQGAFLAHNLNYTDKMGMAHGVEIRVPYLDKELATLAAKIPPSLKMKGTNTKYLLRKVAEKHLPPSIINRPKSGFGAPLRSWLQLQPQFRTGMRDRLDALCQKHPELFAKKAIDQLFVDTVERKTDGVYTLYALVCMESWLRQFTTN